MSRKYSLSVSFSFYRFQYHCQSTLFSTLHVFAYFCKFLQYLILLFFSIFSDEFAGVAAKIDEHTKRVKLLVDLGRKEDRERDAERVREKRRERKMKYEKKAEDGDAGEGGGRVAILGGSEEASNVENGDEENGDEENGNDENELDEYGNNKYDKGRYEGNDFGSDDDEDNNNDDDDDENNDNDNDEDDDSEDDIKKYKTTKVKLNNKKGTKRSRVQDSDDDDDEEEFGEGDLKAQEAMALKMLRKK